MGDEIHASVGTFYNFFLCCCWVNISISFRTLGLDFHRGLMTLT